VLALGLPLGSRFKGLSGPLGSAWGYGRAGFVEMASLQKHAVPLDERALAGLAHSSLALDTYAWLAQRLHRVPRGKPQLVPWASLKEQFGARIGRMRDFKRKFHISLDQVLAFYPAAKVEGDQRGLTLYNSFPPIKKRMVLVDNSRSRAALVDNPRN